MSKRTEFLAKHPDRFFMDAENQPELLNYLQQLGWLSKKETILHVETPGDGNMNYLLRLKTSADRDSKPSQTVGRKVRSD